MGRGKIPKSRKQGALRGRCGHDRVLGGGLDTTVTGWGGEEMGWGAPTRQRESSPTQTDITWLQRVIRNWEERAKNRRSSWVFASWWGLPLASSPPEPPRTQVQQPQLLHQLQNKGQVHSASPRRGLRLGPSSSSPGLSGVSWVTE